MNLDNHMVLPNFTPKARECWVCWDADAPLIDVRETWRGGIVELVCERCKRLIDEAAGEIQAEADEAAGDVGT